MVEEYRYPYSVQSLPVLALRNGNGSPAPMASDDPLQPASTTPLAAAKADGDASIVSGDEASASSSASQQSPAFPSAGEGTSAERPAERPDFINQKLLEGKVIEALREVYDPEIPVNIYELGLIYDIQVDPDRKVHIKMTLTAPACPVAGSLPGEVERKVEAVPEVTSADVELVWEPPWSRDRMSEAALLQLGMF